MEMAVGAPAPLAAVATGIASILGRLRGTVYESMDTGKDLARRGRRWAGVGLAVGLGFCGGRGRRNLFARRRGHWVAIAKWRRRVDRGELRSRCCRCGQGNSVL